MVSALVWIFMTFSKSIEVIFDENWIGITIISIVVVYIYVLMGLCMPFVQTLSINAEREHSATTVFKRSHMTKDVVILLKRSFNRNSRWLMEELLLLFVLSGLTLITYGNLIFVLLGSIIVGYYTGKMIFEMVLHRYDNDAGIKMFLRDNKKITFAIGLGYMLIFCAPLFGLAYGLPLATVAATYEVIQTKNKIPT